MREIDNKEIVFALNDHFYDFIDDWEHKFYFLVGGYGSSKSYHVVVKLTKKLLQEKRKALVIREVFDTIRDSCFDLLEEVANAMGVEEYLTFTTSPMQVRFKNGSRIIFKGMDKPAKLKSLNGVSVVWIEECSEVKYEGFKEILGRLRHPTLSNHIILSTNPVSKSNWCYKYFFQDRKNNVLVLDDEELYRKRIMIVGNTYYHHSTVDGKEVEESYKSNNKLAHAKYKNQVDEKIAYLLSKPVTYKSENEQYAEKVKSVLGKHFQHQLTELGYEATNKSIGWLHPYIDENGEFKTMVIPFEQCIPIWKDRTHLELTAFIRHYSSQIWENNQLKTITNVEMWTEEGVTYYRLDGKLLIYDSINSQDEFGEVSHFRNNDTWQSWGKIPFIPFKNNWKEMPDIKVVKSLIDEYDKGRSEAANYVEDVKNLIFVLKGYGGTSLGEFMQDLNYYHAVKIDDPDDGGVDTITPTMDITAIQSHYEQLKRDIIEDGQSVNKDLDKYGNSPSGVALKFMYAGLDLKCNLLEAEFKIAFEILLYFVDAYLEMKGQGNFKQEELELVFNRNMTINETEAIQNCKISEGTISNKTILAHHPFVNDVEEELEAVKEQEEAEGPEWDKVPTKGREVDEE